MCQCTVKSDDRMFILIHAGLPLEAIQPYKGRIISFHSSREVTVSPTRSRHRLLHGMASARMAFPRTCTIFIQLLPLSLSPGNYALNRASIQSSINSPLHNTRSRDIVSLVFSSIAFQSWGWSSPSFLLASILCICSSFSMTPIFPADAVFFLGWPTWAKLAIVS